MASFTEASGVSHYNLVFNDVLDRDAGYYETFDHTDVWWDRDNVKFPNFHRWETYLGTILAAVGKPGVVWQIPVGNQYFDTENNSRDHTQDNRVEYFFAHPTELTIDRRRRPALRPRQRRLDQLHRRRQRRGRRTSRRSARPTGVSSGTDLRQPPGHLQRRRRRLLPDGRHRLLPASRHPALEPRAGQTLGTASVWRRPAVVPVDQAITRR